MTFPSELDVVHDWCTIAAQAAADKKADHTVILDVGGVLAITDSFVITSASNDRLVRTIAQEVEARVKEAGGPPPSRVEGLREAQWVLMDYGDFVVHIFIEEMRAFYDLERLWSDAPRFEFSDRPAAAGE
jgi:ribosome-associated protein